MNIDNPELILASRSAYRAELLRRLTPSFTAVPADIDESRQPGESPSALAERLARDKAAPVAAAHPDAVVIGSDQVAALGDTVLGKPGNRPAAMAQLQACSGRTVTFYTAVLIRHASREFNAEHVDETKVRFRTLTDAEIDAYLTLDEPWDCAGSFKSESRGCLLFTAVETRDPDALVGLPLIWLAGALRDAGISLLV
jgi:septum formation protein